MDGTYPILGLFVGMAILGPLALKWDLPLRSALPAVIPIGLLSGFLAGLLDSRLPLPLILALMAGLNLAMALGALLWRFFRDPERTPPNDEAAILAPADGKIIYIKPILKGRIPYSEKQGHSYALKELAGEDVLPEGGHLIGTAMSFMDVHVNRAPIAGRLSLLKHINGLFLSLRKMEAVVENERMLSVIEGPHCTVGLVQIASRLVRNIVPFCKPGHQVRRGERIGMIRFGSQVDIIIPDMPGLAILVRNGDRVKAGETILARRVQTQEGDSHAV